MSLTAPYLSTRAYAHAAALPWPTIDQVLHIKRSGRYNIGRRIKVWAQLLLATQHRPVFHGALHDMPWAQRLFALHPMLYRALLDNYVDVRHGMRERFHLIAQDLRHLHDRFGLGRLEALHDAQTQVLWADAELGLEVRLAVNLHTPQEGLWRLELLHSTDQRFVYALSFAMVRQHAVIGAMQGAKGEAAPDLIRQATRTLHGVRPHFFLVEVLRALMQAWRVRGITGVDPRHQLKACATSSDNHLVKFDYAAFWSELGGQAQTDGHWRLPLQAQRKDLADIESKKRSMYRKRYAMLDALTSHVQAHS